MAPWWPCTLPGTSYSFSSLLQLPRAFRRPLAPPAFLRRRARSLKSFPKQPKDSAGAEPSKVGRRFIGSPGWPEDSSWDQPVPEDLQNPGLAAVLQPWGARTKTLVKQRFSWEQKDARGFTPQREGSARFSLPQCQLKVPVLGYARLGEPGPRCWVCWCQPLSLPALLVGINLLKLLGPHSGKELSDVFR